MDLTTDAHALENYFDVNTAVIMCAAVKKQLGNNLESCEKNMRMITNLCKVLDNHPVPRFVYISSSAVYGENNHNLSITEETPTHPTSFYGIGKESSERMLQKVLAKGLVILRPAQIYGPGDIPCYGPSGFLHAAIKGDPIVLWGDGTEKREFIFIEDAVIFIEQLLFSDFQGIMNIASGQSYSYVQILDEIRKHTHDPLRLTSQDRTNPKVDHQFNNQKLNALFPTFRFTPLSRGIEKMVEAHTMIPCRICKGSVLPQLNLGLQPICNRFLASPLGAEYKHSLKTGLCQQCGIMQLVDPFPAEELQPRVDWITYNEPEGHLDALAEQLNRLLPPNSFILGVSFKDDSTLERLRKKGHRTKRLELASDLEINNQGAGVETIQRRLTVDRARNLRQKYEKADAIIVRHILEHVYDISQFLQAIKELLKPEGYAIFEVPDCTKQFEMLDYSMLWEEHLVYFTPETYRSCFSVHGFNIKQLDIVPAVMENSLVAICEPAVSHGTSFYQPSFPAHLTEEIQRVQMFTNSFPAVKESVQEFFAKRKIAIFGAGHTSCLLINIFELPLLCVIDDNPHKKGLFMPGSRIPICGSEALGSYNCCVLCVNHAVEEKIVARYRDGAMKFLSFCPASDYSLFTEATSLKEISPEVYVGVGKVITLGKEAINLVKKTATKNERQRSRICTHKTITDPVHEMIIVHQRSTYVRPHKHLDKSESFHILEGSGIIIFFADDGTILQSLQIGDYTSGKKFYYKMDAPYYHTLLITSDVLVFHETTKGPFKKSDTVFAPWSPEEENIEEVKKFMHNLTNRVGKDNGGAA